MSNRTHLRNLIANLKSEIDEQPILFAQLADYYLQLEQPKPAAELLAVGLQQYPNYATAWVIRGNLHFQLNQREEALASFNYALSLNSNLSYAHERCCVLTRDSDRQAYIWHLRELQRIDPLNGNTQKMLEVALLRQAAVDHNLYSEEQVQSVMPSVLKKELFGLGALPSDTEEQHDHESVDLTDDDSTSLQFEQPLSEHEPLQFADSDDDLHFEPGGDLLSGQQFQERQVEQLDNIVTDDDEIEFEPEFDQLSEPQFQEQQIERPDDQLDEDEFQFEPEYNQLSDPQFQEQEIEQPDDQLKDEELQFEPEYNQLSDPQFQKQEIEQPDDQLKDEELQFEPEYDQMEYRNEPQFETESGSHKPHSEQLNDQQIYDNGTDRDPEEIDDIGSEEETSSYTPRTGGYEQQEYPEEISDDLEYEQLVDQNVDAEPSYLEEDEKDELVQAEEMKVDSHWDHIISSTSSVREPANEEQDGSSEIAEVQSDISYKDLDELKPDVKDSSLEQDAPIEELMWDSMIQSKPQKPKKDKIDQFLSEPGKKAEAPSKEESIDWDLLEKSKKRASGKTAAEPQNDEDKPLDWDNLSALEIDKQQSAPADTPVWDNLGSLKKQPDLIDIASWDRFGNLSKQNEGRADDSANEEEKASWKGLDNLNVAKENQKEDTPLSEIDSSWDNVDSLNRPKETEVSKKSVEKDETPWEGIEALDKPESESYGDSQAEHGAQEDQPVLSNSSFWTDFNNLTKPSSDPPADELDSPSEKEPSSWDELDDLESSESIDIPETELSENYQLSDSQASIESELENFIQPPTEEQEAESELIVEELIDEATSQPEEVESDTVPDEGMEWMEGSDQLFDLASLDDDSLDQPSDDVRSDSDEKIELPTAESDQTEQNDTSDDAEADSSMLYYSQESDDDGTAYQPQSNHTYIDDEDDEIDLNDSDDEEEAYTPNSRERTTSKTLAEMYASQGEWSRAVDVYEELLLRQPENEIYKKRLRALKNRLSR